MRAPQVADFCAAAWPVFTPPLTIPVLQCSQSGAGLRLDCRSIRLESVTIDAYLPADCKEAR